MPGNQGGSNWGTTAAESRQGHGLRRRTWKQVALLKLEDVKTRTAAAGGGGPAISAQAGRRGLSAELPGLPRRGPAGRGAGRAVARRRDDADGRRRDSRGRHRRPRADAAACSDISARTSNARHRVSRGDQSGRARRRRPRPRRRRTAAAAGTGRRPAAARRSRRCRRAASGPFYPGVGGNAGNTAVSGRGRPTLPPTRYMSDYDVMATSTKPPYTTLTAYDLNTGEIKWQVPNGDHPPTIARGGPTNTGGVGARNGIVSTQGRPRVPRRRRRQAARLRRGHRQGAVGRAVHRQRARRAGELRIARPPVRRHHRERRWRPRRWRRWWRSRGARRRPTRTHRRPG